MRIVACIASGLLVGISSGAGSTAQSVSPSPGPLVEFVSVNDDTVHDQVPTLEDCGYYFEARGVLGHSGGRRLGAVVDLRGDSLFAQVDSYRASEFNPKDWQTARWTLRIGGLQSGAYHVTVVAGRQRTARTVQLSFGPKRCSD
jgi:hypothetical protein